MEAESVTDPDPNKGIIFYPRGDEAYNQIRKIQYPIQLIIPYASRDTPN